MDVIAGMRITDKKYPVAVELLKSDMPSLT